MNVIREYLVRLGFTTDEPSFRKAEGVISLMERSVNSRASGIAKYLLEAQGAILGAATSISAAILGTVDKVAMADQGYRLLGQSMLMTTESARKMDLVTKGLGASMEQIVWDPELHRRAEIMSADIDRLAGALGPGFEDKMRGIRDLRFELSRLEIAAKFLGMQFASRLFDKLLPGEAGDKIQRFVDWFERKIPELADKLSDYAVPALKTTWQMLTALWEAAKAAGTAFTNIIGLLSGDTSIMGASFSFENMAKAIQHVGEWMVKFFGWITHAEELLGHFASATALALTGKFAEAGEELKAGLKNLTPGSGAVLGSVAGSIIGGASGAAAGTVAGPLGMVIGGVSGATLGAVKGAAIGAGAGFAREAIVPDETLAPSKPTESVPPVLSASRPSVLETAPQIIDVKPSPIERAPEIEPESRRAVPSAERPASSAQAMVMGRGAGVDRDLVERLATAITRFEGNKPNSVSRRHNNPGNLRSWGNYPVVGGYAQFPDWETGMNALRKQIRLLIDRNLSLYEFFGGQRDSSGNVIRGGYPGYAPAKDKNHPDVYASTVGKWLDIDPSKPLRDIGQGEGARQQSKTPPAAIDKSADAPWYKQFPAWLTSMFDDSKKNDTASATPDPAAAALARLQAPIVPPPQYNSSEHNVSVDLGGIYITQPGADAHQIRRAVADGVRDGLQKQTQWDLTQLSPTFG
jgi:hypothetical protein